MTRGRWRPATRLGVAREHVRRQQGDAMKLVVGLGNPGKKYEQTRHNTGFEVIDELARRYAMGGSRRLFHGEACDATISGERLLLLRPMTFMNRSGQSVAEAVRFYKLELGNLLVVCDCMNLPLGRVRLRRGGSPGGHNGLADIVRALGSDDFPRLRVGIGRPGSGYDPADYVLERFRREEQVVIAQAIVVAADAVVCWVEQGIEAAMNRYNAGEAGSEDS